MIARGLHKGQSRGSRFRVNNQTNLEQTPGGDDHSGLPHRKFADSQNYFLFVICLIFCDLTASGDDHKGAPPGSVKGKVICYLFYILCQSKATQ